MIDRNLTNEIHSEFDNELRRLLAKYNATIEIEDLGDVDMPDPKLRVYFRNHLIDVLPYENEING